MIQRVKAIDGRNDPNQYDQVRSDEAVFSTNLTYDDDGNLTGEWLDGDCNCDGQVNITDIGAFNLALSDPAEYETTYPGCTLVTADANNDGDVDVLDINPFVDLLLAAAGLGRGESAGRSLPVRRPQQRYHSVANGMRSRRAIGFGLLSLVVQAALGADGVLFQFDAIEAAAGRRVVGDRALGVEHEGVRYCFSSPDNLALFGQAPARYAVHMDGACARMGPLGDLGDPNIWLVHDGKLYFFRSPDCRDTFRKDPARFLSAKLPEVKSASECERGKELVRRAIDAIGGADRLATVKSWRAVVEETVEVNGSTGNRVRSWSYAPDDRLRFELNLPSGERESIVLNGDQGQIQGRYSRPLYSAGRVAARLMMAHHVLTVLKVANRPETAVEHLGDGRVNDAEADLVRVRLYGDAVTLSIDRQSGRVLRMSYPDIGIWSGYGEVIEEFSDFRDAGGLALPFTKASTFDGKRRGDFSFTYTRIDLNPQLGDNVFLVPASAESRPSAP
ncbi:YHS domain protein [Phycisphaerae bacterium RAS1]|nr:YHS domain protein [Phycisphaerae bacterium RAS1]